MFNRISFHLRGRLKESGRDMTVGKPSSLIIFYSIPLLLGNIFQQMYNMVDTIIVGRLLGTNALAAVGNTGPMNFLVLGFAYGVTSGFAVITAQRFGAHDERGLRWSVAMNIMLNLVIGVIITLLSCLLTMPILRAINTPAEIMEQSFTYIFIIYLGLGAMILYNASACILRAVGDSRSPLVFLIFSSLLNIVLDLVLIIFGKMGVAGAALATVISQAVAGIASAVWIWIRYPFLRVSRKDFVWESYFALQHLRIGLNMAFQFSITAIGVIVLQGALNVFGAAKIAGYTAAQKVEQLVTVAAQTLGVTMANYGGQNWGANRIDRIKDGTNKAVIISLIFSFISLALAWLFSDQMAGMFISGSQPEVLGAARIYLRVCGTFFPVLFLLFIYRNILQSIGMGFWPLMGGVFELIARILVAFLLPHFIGYTGICLAGPVAWIFATLPLGLAYYKIMAGLNNENILQLKTRK
ncbi:MAG: MATE family efflux transporter [Treponema sp.]|nr:MATE family efflux transporter [Treponema sp.]